MSDELDAMLEEAAANGEDIGDDYLEIELSEAAPIILEQQREAMRDQKIARRGLSSRTRLVAAIHAAIHDQG